MQSTNNPYNKSLLVAGVMTVIIGLIIGIGTIILNLNKYLVNLSKYTSNDKIALEAKMSSNDAEYDSYAKEIDNLKIEKQLLQNELAALPKTSNNSAKYLELEQKINSINSRLEELEKLKYSNLTEKNNLRKSYNEVVENLKEKERPKGIIKCYLVGFAIIIVAITTGAYLMHLAFQPDTDDLILKKQLEIDNAYNKKNDTEALQEATDKVLAEMTLNSSPKEIKNPNSKSNNVKKSSSSKKTTKTGSNKMTNNANNSYRHQSNNVKKISSNSKNTTKNLKN